MYPCILRFGLGKDEKRDVLGWVERLRGEADMGKVDDERWVGGYGRLKG